MKEYTEITWRDLHTAAKKSVRREDVSVRLSHLLGLKKEGQIGKYHPNC